MFAPDLSYTPSLPHTIDPLAQDILTPPTPTNPPASQDHPTPITLPDPSPAPLPTSIPTSPSPIAPRHSTGPRAPPVWHAYYQMNFAHIASPPSSSPMSCPTRGTRHPLSNSLSSFAFNPGLSLQLFAIKILYGTNYEDWKESLEVNLAIMNLDLAISEEAPPKPIAESSAEAKAYHARWEHSNCTFLMIMKYTTDKSIKQCVPNNENVRAYLAEFDGIKSAYNSQKGEWSLSDLIAIVTQEEAGAKMAKPKSAPIVTNDGGSHKKKNFKPGNNSKPNFKKKLEKPISKLGQLVKQGLRLKFTSAVFMVTKGWTDEIDSSNSTSREIVFKEERVILLVPFVPPLVIVSPPVEQQVTPLQEPEVDVEPIVDEGTSNNT
ncbi:hypothetical protein Vadar_006271 [Vaccinium darrowii]|uniref:Uncharacterized protein n=1 Tax=Vaccinium darrowii TaxID=229202 RepID=A0ACB7Z9Y1_9ERIC|nr:hypothetical protein Vadar_006271 [Vaccinium darrowii]